MRSQRSDIADEASAAAWLRSAADDRSFKGTSGDDALNGTRGGDSFDLTTGGEDRVYGDAGDDHIYLGASLSRDDRFDGGIGFDILSLTGSYAGGIRFAAGQLTSVEQIDLAVTGATAVTFAAGSVTADSTVFVFGGTASVVIDASAVTGARFQLEGRDGDDHLIGGSQNDLLLLDRGNDVLEGGDGFDRLFCFGFSPAITVDLRIAGPQRITADLTATITGIEGVYGTIGDDVMIGNGDANIVFGAGGKDRIATGAGDDFIIAGASFYADVFGDSDLNGGAGIDVIDFFSNGYNNAAVAVALGVGGYQDTGQGSYRIRNVENLSGTDFDDRLTGDRHANGLYGGAGNDTIDGGASDDALYGDARISFGDLFDAPTTPALLLDGYSGDDALFGGLGADVLVGGAGADRLSGGQGADRFVYGAAEDSTSRASDLILDFARGDVIDVSAVDADLDAPGRQAFHLDKTDLHAGDILVRFDAATDATTLRFFADEDEAADMVIVLSGDHSGIASSDFAF